MPHDYYEYHESKEDLRAGLEPNEPPLCHLRNMECRFARYVKVIGEEFDDHELDCQFGSDPGDEECILDEDKKGGD